MFNRVLQGKLLSLKKSNVVDRHKEARGNELLGQRYSKQHAERRRRTKPSDLKVGDYVLVNQD